MSIDMAPDVVIPGSPGALARLQKRFKLDQSEVEVGQLRLLLPELADPLAYIQQRLDQGQSGAEDLPYWTKVWPASLVLAMLSAGLAWPDDGPLLELGAGLGLPGLVAAARGRQVVLSDLDPDALEFARAAAELNGLGDLVTVRALDWTAPPPDLGRFSTILGAEILYQPKLYPRLVELLEALLAPGGSIFISHQERPFIIGFFQMARERFTIRRSSRTLRDEEGQTTVYLYALTKDKA